MGNNIGWITPEIIQFDKNNREHWLAMKKLAEHMLADLDKERVTVKQLITGETQAMSEEELVEQNDVELSRIFVLEYDRYIPLVIGAL